MKLRQYQEGKVLPFTFEISDPSGNSFIQNPFAPQPDENLQSVKFLRTAQDYKEMGYQVSDEQLALEAEAAKAEGIQAQKSTVISKQKAVTQTKEEQEQLLNKMRPYAQRADPEITAQGIDFSKPLNEDQDDVKKEVMKFEADCYACTAPGYVKMCIATIPFFKEIIIMAFSCESCGHKSTEIKQGGGISEHATKIVFNVTSEDDLNRDIFKSDTCLFEIPELGLELQPGTLGSVYTTVEGLLDKVIENLEETNPFGRGDSATNEKFIYFLGQLKELKEGKKKFTFVLDDPLSNCFIYNPNAPHPDPKIHITTYERTFEQNEELGINQMNV